MSLKVETVTIACSDPGRVSQFWLALLGYHVAPNYPDSIQTVDPHGRGPHILFAPSTDARSGKNRLHFDLRPDDHAAEVDRALGIGARRVDIGQTGDVSWTVLADPEGNEFCILQSRSDYEAFRRRTKPVT